jgi:Na+/proline symporter
MELGWLDWIFILWFFTIAVWIGFYYAKRASRSVSDYFISGRNLPWLVAGVSMVATTFAADTPLAVSGIVITRGIAGNWIWWNMVLSGMLTVFFFARLWRRTEAITDVELAQIRYTGKSAAFLRGFRGIYLGMPITGIIFGWVTLAMAKILEVTLNWPKWQAVTVLLILTVAYITISGLWGVVSADAFQFVIAMAGSILLAIIAVDHIGGIVALKSKLISLYGSEGASQILNFFPQIGSAWMPVMFFVVYLSVQWWAAWYPGAEPGGGGYIAQRMLACKNEKGALLSSFLFNISHYALRPWPWILIGLVALVVYPELAIHGADAESAYPRAVVDFLPIGLRGMVIASFFAAYMSTISTQLNLGAAYLVNDVYKPFIKKGASEKHYVLISRLSVILLAVVGGLITYSMRTIVGGWELILAIGAGTGLVYILRWYWWRVNAWSEISAMIASFALALSLQFGTELNWAYRMLITVAGTTVVWLSVTFLTRPVDKEFLKSFYMKVRPAGMWKPISKEVGEIDIQKTIWHDFIDFIFGSGLIFSSLFGIGKMVLGEPIKGAIYLVIAAILFFIIYIHLSRRKWSVLRDK